MVNAQGVSRAFLRRAALSIGMAFVLFSTSAQASQDGKAAVLAANAQFYAAINKMFTGEIAPIKAVWSHADDG